MKKILNNLRAKPEHVRNSAVYIIAFTITGIVFLFWVFTLHNRFTSPEVLNSFQNDLKPLTVIKDDISSTYKNVYGSANSSSTTQTDNNN